MDTLTPPDYLVCGENIMIQLKTKILFFAGVLIALSISIAAAPTYDLTGKYSVEGTNPGNGSKYSGTVEITKSGDTYKILWEVGTLYAGTGIITGNTLSVAYVDEKVEYVGVVAYTILKNGKVLKGIWAPFGNKETGTETLTRE